MQPNVKRLKEVRPRSHVVAALLFLGCLTGCIKTWQPSRLSPVETVATNPERVLVKLGDGSKHVLRLPRIEDGAIVSLDGRAPLDSIVGLETRQLNFTSNFLIYVATPVGLLVHFGSVMSEHSW